MLLRHFEEEMLTTPKKHALIVRTKLQLRLAWGTTRLTMREYDSEGRTSSKDEKVLLIQYCERIDCRLPDLNIIYKLMTTASRSSGEKSVELPGWGQEDWVNHGCSGQEGHRYGGLDCVKTVARQH